MRLPDQPHVGGALDLDGVVRHQPARVSRSRPSRSISLEQAADLGPVERVEARGGGSDEVEGERGGQHADRRADTGPERRDHLLDAELLGDAVGMDRPGPAEGEERESCGRRGRARRRGPGRRWPCSR